MYQSLVSSSCRFPPLSLNSALGPNQRRSKEHLVERDGGYHDESNGDELPAGVDSGEDEAIGNDADQNHGERGADHRDFAAADGGTADNDGGDREQLEPAAGIAPGTKHPRGVDHARDPGQ